MIVLAGPAEDALSCLSFYARTRSSGRPMVA
jgi:hypothetical protein